MSGTFDLESTYLALDGSGGTTPLPVGPDFWETIERNEAARGTLVGVYPMAADWPHWEMHPSGDEVLVLLDGEVTFVFDDADGERLVPMRAGSTVIVPRGAWHRAIVSVPGRLLALTYGEGTQHRPL